jgi:hypothetical protein
MALMKPRPSAATSEAFQIGLAELVKLGRAPRDLAPEGYAQEVFVLSLNQVAKGADLDEAKSVSWQLLLDSASGMPVAVSIGHPPAGKRPRVTSLARGPLVAKNLEFTAEVESLPEVQRHDYELRRLFIAGLSIRAFWLKSLDGADDLLVPHDAVHEEFKRMQPYPAEKVLSVIRGLAKKRLKFNDSPKK